MSMLWSLPHKPSRHPNCIASTDDLLTRATSVIQFLPTVWATTEAILSTNPEIKDGRFLILFAYVDPRFLVGSRVELSVEQSDDYLRLFQLMQHGAQVLRQWRGELVVGVVGGQAQPQ